MDKAGPSGDYDASNTSIRESKASTLIIEDVFDVHENCLNGIRRGLNLPEFREYRECLPNTFAHPIRKNFCAISITDRSDLSSEQTSPKATFPYGSVNNFRSTTSFNLIKDFPQNSPCSRPASATIDNNRHDHFFICARNTDFTNNNCDRSKSSIDPCSSPELTDSIVNSPVVKKTHLSCDDGKIQYELSACELRKVNNWSAPVGNNRQDCLGSVLTARCIEIPPKRMKVGLNTPRLFAEQLSTSTVMQSCCAKDCEISSANVPRIRNYEFRGCLSAVDGQCESLADPKPRICKSKTDSRSLIFKESLIKSTQYIKSSTGESLSQVYKEIQACVKFDENSLDNKSFRKESQPMFASGTSDISSNSQSTTSYELSEAAKTESYLRKSHSDKFSDPKEPDDEQQWPTVNRLIDDFNDDSDKCSNCQCLDSFIANDHYSISRPTSCTSGDNANLKITIPSSAEDEEFVNTACLEPNITTIESGNNHRSHRISKFRFWRFKRRKDRLGAGDSSATSEISDSESQASKSSLSYIVSPVKVDSKMQLHMITTCEKPNVKTKPKSLESKTGDGVDLDEKELSVINYSDFCLPIKSLDKLPDQKSVKDILHTMSQSVFKQYPDAVPVEEVDSIGDCSDLKEDNILGKFSSYSQFKTRAELLAEHLAETERDKEENLASTKLSKIIKQAKYPLPPSSSDDNSEANYYLNRRKQQNTQIRFYEIPSPINSISNLNQRTSDECKHEKIQSDDDTVVKINDDDDEDDDDVSTGFCANCFCKHLLFPKMSRSYFL